jgi:hypothetical protein
MCVGSGASQDLRKEITMGDSVIFMGWDRVVAGREQLSMQLFQDTLQYLGGQQAAGNIDSFEPVLLRPHGGDLNGFFLIRGESGKLNAMVESPEWTAFVNRGTMIMQGLGVVPGVAGELLMEWMAAWGEAIPD